MSKIKRMASTVAVMGAGAIAAVSMPQASAIVEGKPAEVTNAASATVRISAPDKEGMTTCTGTMIAPNYFLTARHCFKAGEVEGLKIDAQGYSWESAGSHSDKGQVIYAPNGSGDIALVKTDTMVGGVRPVSEIAGNYPVEADYFTAVGWGTGSQAGTAGSPLKEIGVKVIDVFESDLDDGGVAIRAFYDGGLIRQGDSGGPLISAEGIPVGVTSHFYTNKPNATSNFENQGEFYAVAKAADWIISEVNGSAAPRDYVDISGGTVTDNEDGGQDITAIAANLGSNNPDTFTIALSTASGQVPEEYTAVIDGKEYATNARTTADRPVIVLDAAEVGEGPLNITFKTKSTIEDTDTYQVMAWAGNEKEQPVGLVSRATCDSAVADGDNCATADGSDPVTPKAYAGVSKRDVAFSTTPVRGFFENEKEGDYPTGDPVDEGTDEDVVDPEDTIADPEDNIPGGAGNETPVPTPDVENLPGAEDDDNVPVLVPEEVDGAGREVDENTVPTGPSIQVDDNRPVAPAVTDTATAPGSAAATETGVSTDVDTVVSIARGEEEGSVIRNEVKLASTGANLSSLAVVLGGLAATAASAAVAKRKRG